MSAVFLYLSVFYLVSGCMLLSLCFLACLFGLGDMAKKSFSHIIIAENSYSYLFLRIRGDCHIAMIKL